MDEQTEANLNKNVKKQSEHRAQKPQLTEGTSQLMAANRRLKAVEEELRKSRRRYKTIFEGIINAVAVYGAVDGGRDFIFRNINPAAEKMEKKKKEVVLGKSVLELFPAVKQFGLFEVLQEVYRTGRPKHFSETRHSNGLITAWRENYVFKLPNGNVVVSYEDITNRKRAEEARIEEHNLLRTLIDTLPDTIYVKDTKSRFVIANVEVARRLGADDPDELIGKTDFDFFPDQIASNYYSDERKIIASGESIISKEERLVNKTTGETMWNLATKVPWRDSSGNIVGIIGIGRDITERKNFEQQLKSANQQLLASEQQLKAVNQQLHASEQQLKAANQQLRALNEQLMVDEQQLKAVNQQLQASEQQLKAANQQLRALNEQLMADEQQLKAANQQLLASEQQLRAANQQLKATEEELRKSRRRYKMIFESTVDGMAIYEVIDEGSDFILRNLNPAGEKIEKIKKDDVVGKSIIEVFPAVKQSGLFEVLQRVWTSSESEHYPSCLYKDDVIVGWRENYVFKLPSGEIVVMFEDVTEKVKAEKQLKEYQDKLKFLASELSLTEDRERRRIATELHDRISQSLVISKVKLQAIREIVDSPDILHVINEVSDSLSRAIDDARSLTFDLSSPILHELGLEAAVYEWLREQIKQKHGIAFEFDDDLKPKPLEEDIRSLLFRDIKEVLVNVVKHAKADNVRVSIRRAGHQIRIIVEDDGVGLSVSEVTSRPTRTGGFGLFSIRERLEPLGGRLEIVSELNQGCRVTIFAPLKEMEIVDEV